MAGQLDKNNVENVDETHFIFNMDSVNLLWFKRADDGWAHVVSESKGKNIVAILLRAVAPPSK